jgi:hypothetical protein
MKPLLFSLSLVLAISILSCTTSGSAQTAEDTTIKNLVEGKNFVFQAQSVQPSGGASRQLTTGYELRVSMDTLIAQLPYFGRAYAAPMDMRGGGIEFTSTDFAYTLEAKKKGRWNISIEPKDGKDVRQMNLSVSENGYASLQVLSNNRDPISFSGIVVERAHRK